MGKLTREKNLRFLPPAAKYLKKLQERRDELRDFVFYQAEYDDAKQEIVIRKKNLWKL